MVGRPSRMYGNGRETLPEVRKWSKVLPETVTGRGTHTEVLKWSGDPPRDPEELRRHSRMSGSGRKPSRISRTGWETLPDVWNWSGDPP